MVAVFIKSILYRVISPACLIFAALIRPSLLSLLYALLALLNPLFPRIRASYPLSTSTKAYLTLIVLTALATSICQLVYQIAEHVIAPEDEIYIEECKGGTEGLKYWLRQVGFTRVPSHQTLGFRFMLPEIVALISSLITLVVCLTKNENRDLNNETLQTNQSHTSGSHHFARSRSHPGGFSTITALKPSLQRMSDILLTFFTLFLGVIQPSILNFFYFFMFLFLLTWYALYTKITRRLFNTVKLVLISYSGLHLLVLYTYQIQASKDFLPPDHIVARLLGFTDLARSASCSTWWQFTFNSYWTAYVNYIALWVYFFCAVTQFNWTRTGIHNFGERGGDDTSSDHEELLPIVPDAEPGPNSIPLERITSAVLDRQKISVIFRRPGEKETTTTEGLTAITFFFLYHSYVFQLIAMMTWALLYHSVFGLVFLFLACVLWALRESRKWCFRLSPFLLAYVEVIKNPFKDGINVVIFQILLIAQYIYSLDLIAGKELPVSTGLEIIGFQQAASRSAAFLTLGVKVSHEFIILWEKYIVEE
jgi:hypothetical protein